MEIAEKVRFYRGDSYSRGGIYRGVSACNSLVLGQGDLAIIDPSFRVGPDWRRVRSEMEADGVDLGDVRWALVTHYHPDHVAGAKPLLKSGSCELWTHKLCAEYLHNAKYQFSTHVNYPKPVKKEIFGLPDILLTAFAHALGYSFDYFRANKTFQGNQKISVAGFDIEVIETFGHCRGHVTFFLPATGTLVSGDVFTVHKYSGPSANSPDSDFGQAFRDLKALRQLGAEALIPGHSDPVFGATAVGHTLENLIHETEQLLERIVAIIAERPLGLLAIMTKLLGRHSLGLDSHHCAIIYNILKFLRDEGLALCLCQAGRISWQAT